MRQLLRKIKTRLYPPDRVKEWSRMLDKRMQMGKGTRCLGSLEVRGHTGCSLSIGEDSDIQCAFVFEKNEATICVGSRTHIGGGTMLDVASNVSIGDDVLISFGVLIMDHNSHSVNFDERKNDVVDWMNGKKDWTHTAISPVIIADKVWVGARAIILKGVSIGEGSVVGAGSVVTKNIPAWTIVAGNPARVIRQITR